MENLDDNLEKNSSALSSQAKQDLIKGSGWVKAVAIIGFVGAGLIALSSIAMFIVLPLLGLFYLLMAGAYAYMSYLLFTKAQAASANNFDMEKFAENYYKFWKSAVIIMIIGFVLGIILSVVSVSSTSSLRF
jgi:cytochrome b561